MFKGKLMHGQQHTSHFVINIPAEEERAKADYKRKSTLREMEAL